MNFSFCLCERGSLTCEILEVINYILKDVFSFTMYLNGFCFIRVSNNKRVRLARTDIA